MFDTDGNVVKQSFADLAQVRAGAGGKEKISDFTKKMAQQIRQADALDREAHKQRVRSKRRRQKERQREEDEYSSASSSSSSGDEAGGGSSYGRVTLGRPDDSGDDNGVGGMDDGDERMFSESSTKRGLTALSASTELTEEPIKSRKKRARAKESKPSVKTHQRPAQKKKKKKKVKKIKEVKKGKEVKKAPTSIAEAEKLVLQLIGGE